MLSALDLEAQIGSDGATWLDRHLIDRHPVRPAQSGFGLVAESAPAHRRQHHLAHSDAARTRTGACATAGTYSRRWNAANAREPRPSWHRAERAVRDGGARRDDPRHRQRGYPARLGPLRAGRNRTHSLFRKGCVLYELTSTMPESRLLPLVQKFADMLAELPVFAEAFGAV